MHVDYCGSREVAAETVEAVVCAHVNGEDVYLGHD